MISIEGDNDNSYSPYHLDAYVLAFARLRELRAAADPFLAFPRRAPVASRADAPRPADIHRRRGDANATHPAGPGAVV